MTQQEIKVVQALKTSKLYSSKDSEREICKYVTDKINVQNTTLYYKLADVFKLSNLAQVTLRYIERYFTMLAETENFLELDFHLVGKIFNSSDLHITSEIEVFHATDEWVSYNVEERSKFAINLLLTVRLPLLSDSALNYLLYDTSSICNIAESRSIIESVLLKEEKFFNSNLTTRYCNQNLTNIINCDYSGGDLKNDTKNKHLVNFNDFKISTSIKSTEEVYKAVCLKGDVYIFVKDYKNNNSVNIRKYSSVNKVWKKPVELGYHDYFAVCGIVDKIYIIGGLSSFTNVSDSCIRYDTKNQRSKEVAKMNEARIHGGCTIFQGKIVVCAGFNFGGYLRRRQTLYTVEVYDHVADKWSYMPSMVKRMSLYKPIAVKNKLFVVGSMGNRCQMYDTISNKFVLMISSISGFNKQMIYASVSTGEKILFFRDNISTVASYDIYTEEWSEETCAKYVKFNSICF